MIPCFLIKTYTLLLVYIHTISLCCIVESCVRNHVFKEDTLIFFYSFFCALGVKVANEVVYIDNTKHSCFNDVNVTNVYL